MKSFFARSRHIFAAAQTLGMLVSYLVGATQDAVRPQDLLFFLLTSYLVSMLCSPLRKRKNFSSNLLVSFLAMNLSSFIYLIYMARMLPSRMPLTSDVFNVFMLMVFAYPYVLKVILPAELVSLLLLFLSKKIQSK